MVRHIADGAPSGGPPPTGTTPLPTNRLRQFGMTLERTPSAEPRVSWLAIALNLKFRVHESPAALPADGRQSPTCDTRSRVNICSFSCQSGPRGSKAPGSKRLLSDVIPFVSQNFLYCRARVRCRAANWRRTWLPGRRSSDNRWGWHPITRRTLSTSSALAETTAVASFGG